jgi:thiazole synthase ThiGH ThiG subunit
VLFLLAEQQPAHQRSSLHAVSADSAVCVDCVKAVCNIIMPSKAPLGSRRAVLRITVMDTGCASVLLYAD